VNEAIEINFNFASISWYGIGAENGRRQLK